MSDTREWEVETHAGATVLRRLRDARIGADRKNPGMYAVYFFDEEGDEFRAAGRFESVEAAAKGVDLIRAETMYEEAGYPASERQSVVEERLREAEAALKYIAGSLVEVDGTTKTYGHPDDALRRCVDRARAFLGRTR